MKMKKFKILLCTMLFLTLSSLTVFGQDPPTDPPVDPVFDISTLFATLLITSSLVVPVTGWINKYLLQNLTGTPALIVSWIVPIAIAYFGFWFKFGIFADLGPITTGIYGFSMALVSNAVFEWKIVQIILDLVGAKISKDK